MDMHIDADIETDLHMSPALNHNFWWQESLEFGLGGSREQPCPRRQLPCLRDRQLLLSESMPEAPSM